MKRMPKMTLLPKVDANGKPIAGRFLGSLATKEYIPRILRGVIELPIERTRRERAEAKRARKASRA